MATSADKPDCTLVVTVLWGLFACASVAVADNEQPDMEFLEYLGSWEGSEEDWLLFSGPESEAAVADEKKRNDPAPHGEESTESDDES